MKYYLSIEQVNLNLNKYFAGKNGICVEAIKNCINDAYNYYIEFHLPLKTIKAVVDSKKQVWVKQNEWKVKEYEKFCSDSKRLSAICQFKGDIYIPYVWDKKTMQPDHKTELEKILLCVGYAKEKVQSPLQRLQAIAGKDYTTFYKLIKEVKLIAYQFENDRLNIWHSKGQFSFPITNINGNESDNEIQNYFCELLKCNNPYLSEKLNIAA